MHFESTNPYEHIPFVVARTQTFESSRKDSPKAILRSLRLRAIPTIDSAMSSWSIRWWERTCSVDWFWFISSLSPKSLFLITEMGSFAAAVVVVVVSRDSFVLSSSSSDSGILARSSCVSVINVCI